MSDVIVSSPPSALEGERLPSPQAGAGGTASFDMPAFFCPPLARTLPLPSELEEEPDAQEAVDTPLSAHTGACRSCRRRGRGA
ncbi:hypothetical protein EON67_06585 [archaeon]|nr:MAG: hypothetical protein EON67_06585 [archaeon]